MRLNLPEIEVGIERQIADRDKTIQELSDAGTVEGVPVGSGGGSEVYLGDVVGPAGATDNNIATFDTATGKLIQDGGKAIADLALNKLSYIWQSESPVQAITHKRFYVDRAGSILEVRPNVVSGDGTGTMTLDVLKNGTSIYPSATKPNVTAGNYVNGSFTPDTLTFADGDYFEIQVTATGSTTGPVRLVIKFMET